MAKKAEAQEPTGFMWSQSASPGMVSLADTYGFDLGVDPLLEVDLEPVSSFAEMPAPLIEGFDSAPDFDLTPDSGMFLDHQDFFKSASLVDLQWLDPEQEQDPNRLPKEHKQGQAPLDLTKELEQAWGVERRTTGLELVANQGVLPTVKKAEVSPDRVAAAFDIAVRRAHEPRTASLTLIAAEVEALVGPSPARKLLARLEPEFGLLGNVYHIAAALKGMTPSDARRVRASGAVYLVGGTEKQASALGLYAVPEVPWDQAYTVYASSLGLPEAMPDDPKGALRQAFLDSLELRPDVRVGSDLPKHDERAFAAMQEKNRKVDVVDVKAVTEAGTKKAYEKVLEEARGWLKKGKLTVADVLDLGTETDPHRMRNRMASIVAANDRAKKSDYTGEGTRVKELTARTSEKMESDSDFQAALLTKARERVAHLVKVGTILASEAEVILKAKTASEMDRLAAAVVLHGPTMRVVAMEPSKVKDYDGPKVTAFHGEDKKQVLESPEEHQTKKVARWLKATMSEGVMGQALTEKLAKTWKPKELKLASKKVASLREAHEGLAGTVYVDASAYATTGLQGCEKGGAIHRASQVPAVLAMAKCASCVHASKLPSGESMCAIYNKMLVASAPVEDPKAWQKAAIRWADTPPEVAEVNEYNDDLGLVSPLDQPLEFETPTTRESLDITVNGEWYI